MRYLLTFSCYFSCSSSENQILHDAQINHRQDIKPDTQRTNCTKRSLFQSFLPNANPLNFPHSLIILTHNPGAAQWPWADAFRVYCSRPFYWWLRMKRWRGLHLGDPFSTGQVLFFLSGSIQSNTGRTTKLSSKPRSPLFLLLVLWPSVWTQANITLHYHCQNYYLYQKTKFQLTVSSLRPISNIWMNGFPV